MHTIDVQGSGAIASLSCSVVGYRLCRAKFATCKGQRGSFSRVESETLSKKMCSACLGWCKRVSLWCSAPVGVLLPPMCLLCLTASAIRAGFSLADKSQALLLQKFLHSDIAQSIGYDSRRQRTLILLLTLVVVGPVVSDFLVRSVD
jgi:hypothetical protein